MVALAACGGAAPAVPIVHVTQPTPSATTVARHDAPKETGLVLAFEERLNGNIGIALEGAQLFVNVDGKLSVFDRNGPVAPRPSSWKRGDRLVVVGPDAFDPVAQTAHEPSTPKGLSCKSHAFSYDGARMSADCDDPAGDAVYVYDTRTSAELGVFREFPTAAPIREGTITSSGNFIFWESRASGGFEEIKSHVTGPDMSSHSVMSRDESMVFTTVDRAWYTDDKTPARVLNPKNGRQLFELERDVETVFFSPSSRLLAARHMKSWGNADYASDQSAWLTIHDRAGALVARVGGEGSDAVERAAFAPDDSTVAVSFASGKVSVYTIAR
jgi:hypothetical protein